MIRALLLIFEPSATWERILRARRGFAFVLLAYLLPTLVIISAVEGYGLHHWGRPRELGPPRMYTKGEAIIFETAQFIIFLAIVFIGTRLVKAVGETFHGRHTYTQAFVVVGYGLSPLFLLHLLNGLKGISPWVTWGIGIMLSIAVLYQGVPRIMEPDPSHAFGLYVTSSFLLFFITGLARFLTAWYLQGKFRSVDAFVTNLATKLNLPQ